VSNSSASTTSDGNLQGSTDLTTEGNAETSAVAGAAGTDITASTDYGSRKALDGADDVSTALLFMQLLPIPMGAQSNVRACQTHVPQQLGS
jgi:hypothetical protein